MAIAEKGTLIVLLLMTVASCVESSDEEHILHDAIFANYSNSVRPRHSYTEPVDVKIDFELNSISDIDEVLQVMTTIGAVVAVWRDDYLSWTPSDYNGIDHLVVSPKEVWLPDIGLANSADTFFHSTYTTDFRVHINYTGEITWAFGGNFATQCTLDLTHFPFDKQICTIVIENWAYPADAVNTTHNNGEVYSESISDNGIWHYERSTVGTSYIHHSYFEGHLFPVVTVSLYLTRKPSFYMESLIIPCVMILMVQLSVFWMPADAGEKASLGITVLLAFAVFQIVIDDSTPNTSDYSPVIATFVLTIMTISTFSTVLSIFILYFHHHDAGSRVPRCLRVFLFKYCARVLCMRSSVPEVDNKVGDSFNSGSGSSKNLITVEPMASQEKLNGKKEAPKADDAVLAGIQNQLKYLVEVVEKKEEEAEIQGEWKAMAAVIDRIFFWSVSLVAVIGLPCILVNLSSDFPTV